MAQDAEPLIQRVEQASRELREAIIAADHGKAERASCRYVETLQKLWEALPEQERARSSVPGKACELLDWARRMAVIQRSLAADQLRVLEKASRYQNSANIRARLQIKA